MSPQMRYAQEAFSGFYRESHKAISKSPSSTGRGNDQGTRIFIFLQVAQAL